MHSSEEKCKTVYDGFVSHVCVCYLNMYICLSSHLTFCQAMLCYSEADVVKTGSTYLCRGQWASGSAGSL